MFAKKTSLVLFLLIFSLLFIFTLKPYLKASVLLTPANREAIILHPFFWQNQSSINQIRNGLISAGYSVKYLENEEVDISSIKRVSQYGVIYIHTHGGLLPDGQIMLSTGTEIDKEFIKTKQTRNLIIGRVEVSDSQYKDYLGFKARYLKERVLSDYPKSLIYIDACEPLENSSLPDAVFEKGALAVIGWRGLTYRSTIEPISNMFFNQAIQSGISIKEAYDYAVQNFPQDTLDDPSEYLIVTKYTIGENSFYLNPSNHPPVGDITKPSNGLVFTEGDEITFTGTGTDPEDGTLTGDRLVWTSDKDGQIGTGESLSISTLSVNTHIITLTVTDDDSNSGTSSITITINNNNLVKGPIPDTGQTDCYNAEGNSISCPQSGEPFYGQDAQYATNHPSYTKLDGNGNELPDSASEWIMTRDNVTGLIWEVKSDDWGIHDKRNTYTWAEAQTVFIVQLNNNKFGGYNDWRLPTVNELFYLTSLHSSISSIDPKYFPNNQEDNYWSSTICIVSVYGDSAWSIDFDSLRVDIDSKLHSNYVRAVRGKKPDSHLIINGDGTVTDTTTGLMWQQGGPQGKGTWQEALNYCEGLEIAGYTNWRLPNIKELRSIVDYSHQSPAIDTISFPGTKSDYYWSSSTYPYDYSSACIASFGSGHAITVAVYKPNTCYFRAVRNVSP